MEFGRITPKKAIKQVAKVALLSTGLCFLPQTAHAQNYDSQTVRADCSPESDVILRITTRGKNSLTVKEVETGLLLDLTPNLAPTFQGIFHGTILALDYRMEPHFGQRRLDLKQGRHYQIETDSDQSISSISIALSCLNH